MFLYVDDSIYKCLILLILYVYILLSLKAFRLDPYIEWNVKVYGDCEPEPLKDMRFNPYNG